MKNIIGDPGRETKQIQEIFRLAKSRENLMNLSIGEPDFEPLEELKKATV